jgi:hypothetical protein
MRTGVVKINWNYPMSLVPYGLVRPFLFGMDAEAAHDFTLQALARTQGTPLQLAYAQAQVADPVTIAGLRFPNRVGLAAGLDKNARCIDALGAMGFGFVEVGTVTPLAQNGNPKPRMFRLPDAQALINRMGFNNGGLAAFVANVQASQLRRARHDELACPDRHGCRHLGAVAAVVHEQHLQVSDVVHAELVEPVGQQAARLGRRAVARRGHEQVALEPAARAVVNTPRLAPRGLQGGVGWGASDGGGQPRGL